MSRSRETHEERNTTTFSALDSTDWRRREPNSHSYCGRPGAHGEEMRIDGCWYRVLFCVGFDSFIHRSIYIVQTEHGPRMIAYKNEGDARFITDEEMDRLVEGKLGEEIKPFATNYGLPVISIDNYTTGIVDDRWSTISYTIGTTTV